MEHHHEPESTECGCGEAMVRVGEDVSERLDIIPAEFFVHRQIYGKWACRCCRLHPELLDGAHAPPARRSGWLGQQFLERQIKPWQMGRTAWLFAGSELAGQRAAVVMSLVQSAKMNGHDPWQYLRDVLARLPTHMNSRIEELLPHRWQPSAAQ